MKDDLSRLEDGEVIEMILGGRSDAFSVLLDRYGEHVLKIVSGRVPSESLEETVHEVFVRAFRSLKRFEGRSPFAHWLASLAVRTCHDHWRRRYRDREVPVGTLTEEHERWLEKTVSEESALFHGSQESGKEAAEILELVFSRMEPEDRTIIQLVHLDGYSVSEAAGITGWSAAKVKIRAFRARKKMRKIIEGFTR